MKLIEYRIMMPLTVDENRVGQLWSFAEVSRQNTGGGEGVQIECNKFFEVPRDPIERDRILFDKLPNYQSYQAYSKQHSQSFDNQLSPLEHKTEKKSSKNPLKKSSSKTEFKTSSSATSDVVEPIAQATLVDQDEGNFGQYTHKLYLIASKLPWFLRKILSKESQIIHEKSWNMYPNVKTVLTNDFFRTTARIEMDTITRPIANGQKTPVFEENVHCLSKEQLDKREIVVIDISDLVDIPCTESSEDPTQFKSTKTGRGMLRRGEWQKKHLDQNIPLICCYKLVFMEFKVFGLQTKAESYLKQMYKQLFAGFHRQVFCWMDKWHGLTLVQVKQIDVELAKALAEKLEQGEISKAKLMSSSEKEKKTGGGGGSSSSKEIEDEDQSNAIAMESLE